MPPLADIAPWLNAFAGVTTLAVAAFVVVEVRRTLGRVPPLAIGVAGVFVLGAVVSLNRSELLWERTTDLTRATLLDVAAAMLLLVVLWQSRSIGRTIVAVVDHARFRAAEYERARRDYAQIVRHRMLNPVTVIRGAALTLEAGVDLDPAVRAQLCRAIVEATELLEDMSLEPERRGVEERSLDAVPRVDDHQGFVEQDWV